MAEPLIQHVSDTAFMVAHHRAAETARPDALFSDPLAARLAGERGAQIARAQSGAAMVGWHVSMRTLVIDDYLRAALERGVDMVVNLGAGLDTRPYRLALPPALRWIEVDYPEMIAFKEERLAGEQPRCQLERVGLDLADLPGRRALLARLDGAAGRLLVLTEGVIPYLDQDQAGALAGDLRALRRIDGWIVDYTSREAAAYRRRIRGKLEMRHAPFRFDPDDWFAFFAARGWKVRTMRYLPEESARLGRPVPLPWPLRLVIKVLGAIAPANRRDRLTRFAGYAVLEPAASS
jgi:methyltransferase (TIGR00027 family)